MLALIAPLRMIAQYEPVEFPDKSAGLETRKQAVRLALSNCYITRDIGTEQMNLKDSDLVDDLRHMRAAALTAIPLAEAALRADTLEDFNNREGEFRREYVNLIRSVKSFLWDAKGSARHHLWPLIEELM